MPRHVAVVMDGNGRWANQRGLPRTKGHEAGEAALLDVVAGAIEIGVTHLSAYAFSTENWSAVPDEVRFLMGFNRDVIRRRRDQLNAWGVRMRWVGPAPAPVALGHQRARDRPGAHPQQHRPHPALLRQLRRPRRDRRRGAAHRRAGRQGPSQARTIDERTVARYLPEPDHARRRPVRAQSSGEQRTSNFLLWQSAYAEMVFLDTLWPDFDRRHLWAAIETYVDARPSLRRSGRPAHRIGARSRAVHRGVSRSASAAGDVGDSRRDGADAQPRARDVRRSRPCARRREPCSRLTRRPTPRPPAPRSTVRRHDGSRWWW